MSGDDSPATEPGSEVEDSSPSSTPAQSKKRTTKPSKARLTSAQKNTNHRDAENKRRDGIRAQFDALSNIVPGTQGQAKSEQHMLTRTAEHLEDKLKEIREMIEEMDRKGIPVEDSWRAMVTEDDFGGANYQTPAMAEYEAKKQRADARKGNGAQRTGKDGDDDDDDDRD
ncbi:uncharacterized protein HMPREF1541_07697 [Cyphellophora europaea CBS 101466]|uniref:BHLH domain-containing protein n=1 Tax=Cyphellophora europaea (strain CBS 101466) TaxID=1220924 RepID=W2RQS8_CYPE1|nr:uncharacterized protein HMPREF1541_07697 [Cyphellophora europaea CBS 101466]ETN38073.1 hypothetical protein HMPREF1541_07697 [Cyphellophora europaea CBS 101466]